MADARAPASEPAPATMASTGNLMAGKRGLIMGVANDHSIAWGIAQAAAAQGAELAFTYQTDAFARRVGPLAESVNAAAMVQCDASDMDSLDKAFAGCTFRKDHAPRGNLRKQLEAMIKAAKGE